MKTLFTILAFFTCSICAFAQYGETASRSLFSDPKASRKGDAITILIVEETSADIGARTSSTSNTDLSIGVGGSVNSTRANANATIGTGNSFSGRGETSRNESVRAKLTARITEAENLNSMKIEGKRTVTINGETQVITISGIIRYIDILPDNTIYSFSIADLTLSYNGDGTISKAQEPGLFTKFLRFLF